MDLSTVTQLISSVGFPIVACAAMFWQMNKNEERHKEEMDKLNVAVENNTLAIEKLITKLGGEENDTGN